MLLHKMEINTAIFLKSHMESKGLVESVYNHVFTKVWVSNASREIGMGFCIEQYLSKY